MNNFFVFCALLLLSVPRTVQAEQHGILLPPQVLQPIALPGSRTIRIYLPPSYSTEPHRRYPVLYLHDGQNVFSSAGTNCSFGWGAWNLDVTADRLIGEHKMSEIIMVAIDNSLDRFHEFDGQARTNLADKPTSYDRYAAFIIHELKPFFDARYRTKPGASDTAVMGSSLGGVCSLALGWQHPEVFGKVASLSGAYQINNTSFLKQTLAGYHGKPKPLKIYLDSGVVDFTGGDDNCALNDQVAKELTRLGWGERHFLRYVDAKPLDEAGLAAAGLRKDKWNEAKTSQHNEFYWRERSWRALEFLFPK